MSCITYKIIIGNGRIKVYAYTSDGVTIDKQVADISLDANTSILGDPNTGEIKFVYSGGEYSIYFASITAIVDTADTAIAGLTTYALLKAYLESVQYVASTSYPKMDNFDPAVSPVDISADTDDLALPSVGYQGLTLDVTGAYDLTGLAAPVNPEHGYVFLWNVGVGILTLTNQDAASAAANRFLLPNGADTALNPNAIAVLWYDSVGENWMLINTL